MKKNLIKRTSSGKATVEFTTLGGGILLGQEPFKPYHRINCSCYPRPQTRPQDACVSSPSTFPLELGRLSSKLDVEKILTPSTRIKTTSNTCPAPPARRGPVEELFAGVELRGAPSVRIEGTWAVKLECAVWQTCYFELEGGEEEDSHRLVPAPPGAAWADTARANTARRVGKKCIASRASFAPQPLHLYPHVKVVPGRWTRISDMTTQIHDLTFLTTRTIQRMIQAENRQLWEVISSEKHQKPEELLPASKHSETQGAHPVQLRGQKNVRVHSSKGKASTSAEGLEMELTVTLREGGAHARSRLHGRQRNKGDGEDVTGEVHLSYEMGISPSAAKSSWHARCTFGYTALNTPFGVR
ncbi:hypothetical protein C8J57DRAFT_1245802 [Mycena rebaudengoi]|nr:hypothetical protein C8J57DRAFT_1245802 [Mycena rebaudengoi]